ncbi:toll-like receptor 3 [Ostrea edulis]|uniref:toll-like receptor 3 n=1 Tax=Ostrea edulis TaxID=37623 RepID=UPI0024AF36AA|nr:toll-like receptor 3 [Ostrea edulis]
MIPVTQSVFFILLAMQDSILANPCTQAEKTIPKMCKCSHYGKSAYVKIICVNTNRTSPAQQIPKMPNNTSSVHIQRFQLVSVTKETFGNLMNIPLMELTLRDNNIENISVDALSELQILRYLEISGETKVSKQNISLMMCNVTKTVKYIRFSHNVWDTPPDFKGLKHSLYKIDLSFNYFHSLNGTWFADLRRLRVLDVSFNGISENSYNFTGIENVTNLFLQGNWFKTFPKFCNYSFKNLQKLHFQFNKLTEFKREYFSCLPDLTLLNLNGHAIRKLYNNTFTSLSSLKILKIQRSAGQLFHIEARAFESTSLKELLFTGNGFWFQNTPTNPALEYFKHCPNLTLLNITSNKLKLKGHEFISMMKPLKKLQVLGIRDMNLNYLPRGFMKYLPHLFKLDVSDNFLQASWDGESVFGYKSKLRFLDLSDNNIEKITPSNFPERLLNGMSNTGGLDVSHNKFSCNCDDALWFYKWMHSNKEKLSSVDNITCRPNAHDDLGTIILFNLTEKDLCPINPAVVIAIITFCSVLMAVLLVLVVVYKLRWHIRHWLYVVKQRRRGYEIIKDDPDFNYDIYIVYADEDNNFVFKIAVPYLEDKGYSLCVRCRDFEIGKIHCDNIVDNMNQSRRVLLILSNHFAKSKWCEFQMHFSYNRCLEEKRNNIIVAVLTEISYKYLSNTLKALLTTHDYALWSKYDETGQNLFWGKVLRKLQFQSDHTESADDMIGDIQ